MYLGIDITSIVYDRGVSRYTANLVRALAARNDVALSLYGSSLRQKAMLDAFVKDVQEHARYPQRVMAKIQSQPPIMHELFWNKLHVQPIRQLLPRVEVFHSWDWLQPPDQNLPLVSTIHDLAILKFPELVHPKILAMHQRSWQTLRTQHAQIIAVSRTTQKDIIELLEIPRERVHVIYEALPQETVTVTESLTDENVEAMKKHLELRRPYIFFVGTREPRKNLLRLIEAWRPLAKDVELLIAGEV